MSLLMYQYFSTYNQWSTKKLNFLDLKPSFIAINDFYNISYDELSSFVDSLERHNFFIYELSDSDSSKDINFDHFCSLLGLEALDSHLCVSEDKITKIFDDTSDAKSFYIPYTNKSINWHSDGYYNKSEQSVHAFILHCANPAFEGGVNSLLDQDQVFIYLMQQNPLFIKALMDPTVMTIPENRKEGVLIRPETSTAIFNVLNDKHDVLMRYSMRKKNIIFKQDALTKEALACMDEFINSDSSPYISIKLKAGQGVACNNVLHKRTSFKDKVGSERLYYRARFYNRIQINS